MEILWRIIPLCAAASIDPVLLTLTLTLLSGKKSPKGQTVSFLLGAAIVMALIAYLGILIGEGVMGGKNRVTLKGIVDIIFGILLLYLGVSALLEKKHEINEEKSVEKTEKEVKGRGFLKWLIVGFIVNITNVDALVLYLTACKEIGHTDFISFDKIILAVIGGAIVLIPILIPLILSMLIPKTAEKVLVPVGKFMSKYGAYIIAVIFFIFGIMLVAKGVEKFV